LGLLTKADRRSGLRLGIVWQQLWWCEVPNIRNIFTDRQPSGAAWSLMGRSAFCTYPARRRSCGPSQRPWRSRLRPSWAMRRRGICRWFGS